MIDQTIFDVRAEFWRKYNGGRDGIVGNDRQVDAMAAEIARLRHDLDIAASHINELVDNDACQKDHHGYCQTHFLTNPCVVDEARTWLANYVEEVQK